MRTIIVNWENLGFYHRYWLQHHKLRHKIFVERLGWNLGNHNGLEYDEFDTPAAQYVLAINHDDCVVGVSRLAPTNQPYMIRKLWPEWLNGTLPCNGYTWEASRFGTCEELSGAQRSEVCDALVQACYRFGQENHVSEFLMVMPVFVYRRILRRNNIDYELASSVRDFNGIPTAIARVPIPEKRNVPSEELQVNQFRRFHASHPSPDNYAVI